MLVNVSMVSCGLSECQYLEAEFFQLCSDFVYSLVVSKLKSASADETTTFQINDFEIKGVFVSIP